MELITLESSNKLQMAFNAPRRRERKMNFFYYRGRLLDNNNNRDWAPSLPKVLRRQREKNWAAITH